MRRHQGGKDEQKIWQEYVHRNAPAFSRKTPPGKRQLERRSCRWKNNIKNDFIDEESGLD